MRAFYRNLGIPAFGLLVLASVILRPVALCRAADRPNFVWLISEDN